MVSKITKNTTLGEILKSPAGREVLTKHNLPCLSCPFASLEIDVLQIGQVCESYGIDLKKVLKDLNKAEKEK